MYPDVVAAQEYSDGRKNFGFCPTPYPLQCPKKYKILIEAVLETQKRVAD